MKTSILTFTTLGALATALPTSSPPKTIQPIGPVEIRASAPLEFRADGRAATLFKKPNIAGDSTFVPANNYCTDISNIFGGFDGKIKSLSVEKGFKCDFYQEAGCDVNDFTGGGAVLEVGFRNKKDVRRRLGSWEGKIQSVFCQKL